MWGQIENEIKGIVSHKDKKMIIEEDCNVNDEGESELIKGHQELL
jgi:hypothetical protein